MRLLSYSLPDTSPTETGFGMLTGDGTGVIDLRRRFDHVHSLDTLIGQGRVAEARSYIDEPADHAIEDIEFERVLRWPRKIFCIGVNYGGRTAEYADSSDASYPSVFVRYPDSLTGHDHDLIRPPESEQLDYEGEIVAVIGKQGRRIPLADALDHLVGLTLGNEGTIRDWVRHAKFNVTQGKNWESSGAIGPWVVTMEEIGDLDDLELTTSVNGEIRQQDTPASMKYSIGYLIHYLSTFTTLAPGDVIFTGTPTGAGARHDPPLWLEPGDVVEVNVPEIGTLRNTIADEFTDQESAAGPEPR